ncbi:hypothetical protein BHM03_00011750 [Ensete ventricosum]|nr:hypothetical protein BHM03_00011750 [Ensete ventricosum]
MLQKEDYSKFEVKVANGQILKCNQKCPRVKLILQEQDIVADFFLLPLDDFDIVLDIDWLSTIGDIFWNFSKLTIKFFSKGKQVVLRWSQATTTTTQHLERLPKEESSGFPIQIQEFHEIEDKNPLPHLAEILDVSTKPSRLPPLKLSDPPMLNWPKLLPTIARPNCFLQPQKVKDKRVAQEITETWIVRPCLFPATTHPYILFPGYKLLLKCYILPNSPWLLMQYFQISGDFHDFPQNRTMMLKDFLDDVLHTKLWSDVYYWSRHIQSGDQHHPHARWSTARRSENGPRKITTPTHLRLGSGSHYRRFYQRAALIPKEGTTTITEQPRGNPCKEEISP